MSVPDIRIVSTGATDEEVAAVTAVIAASLEELAGAQHVDEGTRVSAWARSQRPVRAPLRPGAGAWR